jgi:hypothetical protein
MQDEPVGLSPEEWAGATAAGTPWRPVREDRAARVFVLLGILGSFAFLVTLAGAQDVSLVERVVRVIPVALWVVAFFGAAIGLGRRRPWAVDSLTVVLALLFLGGIVATAQALGTGRFFLPIDALLVVWVFRAPPAAPVVSTGTSRRSGRLGAFALVATFVLASVGPWLADAALAPGGPLSVGLADLTPALSVQCGAPEQGIPATVTGSFDWTWRRTESLADGTDMVVVGWTGQDDAGAPLFLLGDATGSSPQPGIWQGGGSPSQGLADRFAARFGGFASWSWGVTLAEQRMAPGAVPFTLRRVSDEPVAHGQITVQAAYIHLGKWINRDATATCSW